MIMDSPPAGARNVLTPSSLNRLVRGLLEDAMALLWIEGELSNLARPASGHVYFTLKDAQAQVRCAMFRPRSQTLRFAPAEGQRVLLRARVTLYEPRGDYQLIVESMEDAGAGALARALEELKARLAAEGLFDAARKRALPAYPRRIGVITSASGAAIRDVLSVLRRRFALVEADLLPVPVQGKEAPAAITAMLQRACRSGRYDVVLLTRGGGANEDLAAFNDETVVRAVAACSVPVVAAVGHEIDFTLVDFAADLRAPTPSAAAELLVPDAILLRTRLTRLHAQLQRRAAQALQQLAQRLDAWQARLHNQHPAQRLARARERLQTLHARLYSLLPTQLTLLRAHVQQLRGHLQISALRNRLAAARLRLAAARARQQQTLRTLLLQQQTRLDALRRALHAISPLATLERGYAIVFDAEGHIVRSVRTVQPGQSLHARLADGDIGLRVVAATPGKTSPD
jgi:exodeoxyribonuclease VII large subunit